MARIGQRARCRCEFDGFEPDFGYVVAISDAFGPSSGPNLVGLCRIWTHSTRIRTHVSDVVRILPKMSQTSADRGPNWGDAGQVWPGFGQLEFGPCLSQLGHFRSTFLGLGEESNAQPESLKAFRGPSSRWGLGGGSGARPPCRGAHSRRDLDRRVSHIRLKTAASIAQIDVALGADLGEARCEVAGVCGGSGYQGLLTSQIPNCVENYSGGGRQRRRRSTQNIVRQILSATPGLWTDIPHIPSKYATNASHEFEKF